MWTYCKDKYDVSEIGALRNRLTGRTLKHKINKSGYKYYTVSIDGKLTDIQAHREVAMSFVPGYNTGDHVNHKDGDKLNNHFSNLEWVTPKENTAHAIRTGLFNPHATEKMPVVRIDKTNVAMSYPSIKAAAIDNGISPGGIWRCAMGKRKTAKGFVWKFMAQSVNS